jgi:hypothetical protein
LPHPFAETAEEEYSVRDKAYNSKSLRSIPQIGHLTQRQIRDIEVVSTVFPFKVKNYVLDNLIQRKGLQMTRCFG